MHAKVQMANLRPYSLDIARHRGLSSRRNEWRLPRPIDIPELVLLFRNCSWRHSHLSVNDEGGVPKSMISV